MISIPTKFAIVYKDSRSLTLTWKVVDILIFEVEVEGDEKNTDANLVYIYEAYIQQRSFSKSKVTNVVTILSYKTISRNRRPFKRDDRTRQRLDTQRASVVPRGPPEPLSHGGVGRKSPL